MKLEQHWYRSSLTPLTSLLYPLSQLFRGVVNIRRFLYRHQIKKTITFNVPVIVVGNITVGGTGKTPFTLWLAHFLKKNNYRPGIVSRGVGGKSFKKPILVTSTANVREVGDEAILLQRSGMPVVIGCDRVRCVEKLLAETHCNIVISDDGLQHYRLGRTLEIAMIDGLRALGNQHLLPAGPLREPISRLTEMDFVIETGNDLKFNGDEFVSIKTNQRKPITQQRIHAIAAIGNPERFFQFLRQKNLDIIPHVFPDHYFYSARDFNFSDDLLCVMTEKDAVKCIEFADDRFWYVPVTASVSEELSFKILNKLRGGVQNEKIN